MTRFSILDFRFSMGAAAPDRKTGLKFSPPLAAGVSDRVNAVVILSAAKNPPVKVPRRQRFFAALRMTKRGAVEGRRIC